jgi:hypothetical protein
MSTSRIGHCLSQLRHNGRALLASRRGAVAALVAIAVPVLVGFTALAVDFGYYRMVQNRMQIAVDGAALAAAWEIEAGGDPVIAAVDFVRANVPAEFGDMTVDADVELGVFGSVTEFLPSNDPNEINAVRVQALRGTARANAPQQFFLSVFGVAPVTLTAQAVAARPANVWYNPPESMNLPPEAGDYNELYVYCYNTETDQMREGTMTLIANNLGGETVASMAGATIAAAEGLKDPPKPEDLDWPRCNQRGETLSFRMRNIRHAKSMRTLWANPGQSPGRPEINYYTDTLVNDGVETFRTRRVSSDGRPDTPTSGQYWNMIETVLCDTEAQCGPPGSPGSIIPRGRGRTPQLAGQPCEPGKWMYFGWEDRPPNQSGASGNWTEPAWTDNDFDDIVVRMRCPASGRLGDALVRLVR